MLESVAFSTLIVWILIAYGITNIVTSAKITAPIRKLAKESSSWFHSLITCPMCFSFWTGLYLSIYWVTISTWWLDPFLASGAVWILYCLLSKLEKGL